VALLQPSVDLAAVTEADHQHQQLVVVNLVDDPVVADADSELTVMTASAFTSGGRGSVASLPSASTIRRWIGRSSPRSARRARGRS
jgi:hypothetical protein